MTRLPDDASPEISAAARDVVRLVGVELGRTEAWSARLPQRAADRRDCLDQGLEDARVMQVGGRELNRQWYALPVNDEVVLRAELASIGRVPPGGVAPFFARTLVLSKLARSKSIAPSSPSLKNRH